MRSIDIRDFHHKPQDYVAENKGLTVIEIIGLDGSAEFAAAVSIKEAFLNHWH